MNKLLLVGFGLVLFGGVAFATGGVSMFRDILATGDVQVDGALLVDDGIVSNGTISGSSYTGTLLVSYATAGNTSLDSCDEVCQEWNTAQFVCVEAHNNGSLINCSDAAGAGQRFNCLCQS